MATTLNTEHTPRGIVYTHEDGKAAGVVTYHTHAGDPARWIAGPARFSAKGFRSLEAAEFYMLSCAAEDLEIDREVQWRLELTAQAEAGDRDARTTLEQIGLPSLDVYARMSPSEKQDA